MSKSVTIEVLKKKVHQPPDFLCDSSPLGEHLNSTEMFSHLNKFGLSLCVGRMQSGKTSLLINLLTAKKENRVWNKVFNFVHLIMPASSRGSLKKNVFSNHSPERTYEELTLENLKKIDSELEQSTKDNKPSLIIMDDVTSNLKNKELAHTLRALIYNSRHKKVHIIILIQSYISLPRELRSMASSIIMFKCSRIPWEQLVKEHLEISREMAQELYHCVFQNEHDYLFLATGTGKMYRNQDRIKLHGLDYDDDDDEKKKSVQHT